MVSELDPNTDEAVRGVRTEVPLAPLTTLELGGGARHLADVGDAHTAREAVRWARARDLPVAVLGGGSNLVVADRGFDGLVLRVRSRGLEVRRDHGAVILTAAAGEPWDELVASSVDQDLAGIECLAGIPGSTGATPIQNVGAYGQEVASVIAGVRVLDLGTLEERTLPPAACDFGYRTSCFRRRPERYLVLEVSFRLAPGKAPTVVYDELRRALAARDAAPGLREVRDTVLALRRAKSMLAEPGDVNRRSVGSFFVNPVVDASTRLRLEACARTAGVVAGDERVPVHPVGGGRFKVPAAWLIEAAGFPKGLRRGGVGISPKHALALVHYGGGTTSELLALAREIRDGVLRLFGVTLEPEPVFLGFDTPHPLEG